MAKKIAAITTMMKTITDVLHVSLRDGQVILRPSARTSLMNWPAGTFFFGSDARARDDDTGGVTTPVPVAVCAAAPTARVSAGRKTSRGEFPPPRLRGFLAIRRLLRITRYEATGRRWGPERRFVR